MHSLAQCIMYLLAKSEIRTSTKWYNWALLRCSVDYWLVVVLSHCEHILIFCFAFFINCICFHIYCHFPFNLILNYRHREYIYIYILSYVIIWLWMKNMFFMHSIIVFVVSLFFIPYIQTSLSILDRDINFRVLIWLVALTPAFCIVTYFSMLNAIRHVSVFSD